VVMVTGVLERGWPIDWTGKTRQAIRTINAARL